MPSFESAPPSPPAARTLSTPLAILIVVAVTFAAFWPILSSSFTQWDDAEQIAKNQYLNPPVFKGLAKRWSGPFMNIYIPLTHTVWFFIAFFARTGTGDDAYLLAWPFKLASVLFHAGSGIFVFLILAKLFRSRWICLLGACLFCVHPVQVESVGWTSGLKDVLFGFFGSACILSYMGDPNANYRLSSRAYALAVLMMVCACLSKPTAMVLPAMLLVLDLWIAKRTGKGAASRLLPFIIVSIACAMYARDAQPPIEMNVHLTLLDRLLVPAHSLAFYAYKLLWPARLAFDYGVNWFFLLGSTRLYLAWIVPAVVAAIAVLLRRRVPLFGIGLLLAIIPLAPVSGIVIFDFSYFSITSDHYLYLPLLGVAIAAMALLERISLKAAMCTSVPLLLVLGVLTARQSLTWKTPLRATLQTIAVNPDSFSSYSILSIIELENSGGDPVKLKLAESYARKSIAMRQGNARSHNMLANVLSAQGRYAEALQEIDTSLALSPTDPQYHLARAGILSEMHRGEESIKACRQVLQYDPDNRLARELVDKWDAIIREQRRRGLMPTTVPASQPGK